jgi:hypothetical protein
MNKTEMIGENILSLFRFMTFSPFLNPTAVTAELVYIQWLEVCMTGASRSLTTLPK